MKDVHELEIYAPIEGFPDYLITSHGRVFSLKHGKMKELKHGKTRHGYMLVTLSKNGKQYTKTVHRLVARAFISNPENKTDINHIDEDKTNNHVLNLEWMTHKENLNHGTRNERARQKNSITHKGKKLSEQTKAKMSGVNNYHARAVIGFKINGCEIKYYKFMSECKKDGYDTPSISKCCKGERKSHKGFEWYYADEFFNKNK